MGAQVKVTCLCGKVNQVLDTPPLPVDSEFCHCNPCRYTSGTLGGTFVRLLSKPISLDGLVGYHSSKTLTRWFCGTCGAHCFVSPHTEGRWDACAGVVQPVGDDVQNAVKITSHNYVADTIDGGIAGRLRSIAGQEIACYAESSGADKEPMSTPPEPPASHQATPAVVSADDKLRAKCHCGGVEFCITRPDPKVIPEGWWLRAAGTKYLGKFCVCQSCRLASGFPLQPWTYVPKANMFKTDGSPMEFDLETLQRYESSSETFRYFCNRCGATVFYECKPRTTDLGFDLIDVSVGLLRAGEGSRAEQWLDWWFTDVSHREEAVETDLVDTLTRAI